MRVFVLARNHRNRVGNSTCDACRNWRRSTTLMGIQLVPDGAIQTFTICSGCTAAAHEAAVKGRKVERV